MFSGGEITQQKCGRKVTCVGRFRFLVFFSSHASPKSMTRKKLKAAKRQARNPDFKKLKRKVGKTAPRAANATRVDFTVKRK